MQIRRLLLCFAPYASIGLFQHQMLAIMQRYLIFQRRWLIWHDSSLIRPQTPACSVGVLPDDIFMLALDHPTKILGLMSVFFTRLSESPQCFRCSYRVSFSENCNSKLYRKLCNHIVKLLWSDFFYRLWVDAHARVQLLKSYKLALCFVPSVKIHNSC